MSSRLPVTAFRGTPRVRVISSRRYFVGYGGPEQRPAAAARRGRARSKHVPVCSHVVSRRVTARYGVSSTRTLLGPATPLFPATTPGGDHPSSACDDRHRKSRAHTRLQIWLETIRELGREPQDPADGSQWRRSRLRARAIVDRASERFGIGERWQCVNTAGDATGSDGAYGYQRRCRRPSRRGTRRASTQGRARCVSEEARCGIQTRRAGSQVSRHE